MSRNELSWTYRQESMDNKFIFDHFCFLIVKRLQQIIDTNKESIFYQMKNNHEIR